MGGYVIQMRAEVSKGDENWLDSRSILKIEQAVFLDRLAMVCERKKIPKMTA